MYCLQGTACNVLPAMYCFNVLPSLQTKGLMEQVLVDKMIDFMKQREQDKQPFLIYYAPYAIHSM
jgi:hypothetical protein